MAKYERGTARSTASINDELEKIQNSLADKFDRKPSSGEPNQLETNLDMNGNRIYNLPEPLSSKDAVPKDYVDNIALNGLPVNIGTDKVFESVTNAILDSTLTVGDTVRTLGYYLPSDDGGAQYVVVTGGTGDSTGGLFIDTDNGLQLKLLNQSIKNTSKLGVIGDYNPLTDTGTDNTVRMQAIFDSLQDGDTIELEGNILIDRNSASIKTVQGVSSYILVADGIKNLKVRGTGVIYQRWNETLDTVGVCFFNCDDLHLDGVVFDGNFRYSTAQPINYKQQLVHIIGGKRQKGGFTVRNSSNVGFLISNQHGDTGGGFVESSVNNTIFDYIISENCTQNTTFGTGVNTLTIGNLSIVNPVINGLKISSRVDVGAPTGTFRGLVINSFNLAFDGTWKLPNRFDNSAPHDAIAGIDYVSSAREVYIGTTVQDWENCLIPSIAVKHVGQPSGDTSLSAGYLYIDYLNIQNQNYANSVIMEKDNESLGTYISRIDAENVSKIAQISNVDINTGAQAKESKYLYIGSVRARNHDRTAFNVTDWDGDYIYIGDGDCEASVGFTQQTMRVDASCNINRLDINLHCDSVLTILGEVNNQIKIQGRLEVLTQVADPLTIIMDTQVGTLELDNLYVAGDNDSFRGCQINNLARVEIGKINLRGCPKGLTLNNIAEFSISDNNQRYQDLSVLSPYQFTGTIGSIQGAFSYNGSPNSVQIASIGCSYRRKDTGQLYMKTANEGANSGWSLLS